MNNSAAQAFLPSRPIFQSIAAGFALASVLAAAPYAHATDAGATNTNADRIAIGLQVAPVPLNFKGLNKNNVGLGSYLVTVAACSGCHSNPEFATGSNPFDGDSKTAVVKTAYLAGGVSFGPGVCSANITPDKNGLPAGLTLAHFLSALHTGHDFRAPAKQLLPVMPWPYFRHLTTGDLTAIYTYLKALPSNKTKTCP